MANDSNTIMENQSPFTNQKISKWQILFYLSLTVITIWLILKVTGVIHTAPWLEYGVPIAGFILGLLSFYQDLLENVHAIAIDTATLKVEFKHLSGKVDTHEDMLRIPRARRTIS